MPVGRNRRTAVSKAENSEVDILNYAEFGLQIHATSFGLGLGHALLYRSFLSAFLPLADSLTPAFLLLAGSLARGSLLTHSLTLIHRQYSNSRIVRFAFVNGERRPCEDILPLKE